MIDNFSHGMANIILLWWYYKDVRKYCKYISSLQDHLRFSTIAIEGKCVILNLISFEKVDFIAAVNQIFAHNGKNTEWYVARSRHTKSNSSFYQSCLLFESVILIRKSSFTMIML